MKKIQEYCADVNELRLFVKHDQRGIWSAGVYHVPDDRWIEKNVENIELLEGNSRESAKKTAVSIVARELNKNPAEIKPAWKPC